MLNTKEYGKKHLLSAVNKQFQDSLPNVIDFLRFVNLGKSDVRDIDLWLLRSYQLSILLRSLSMEESYEENVSETNFHYLFDNVMRPYMRLYPDFYQDAMDFFAGQEDAIKLSGFILDVIVLNLSEPLYCIQEFWDKKMMVPVLSKMPFVMNLYWDLFCSAGLAIEDGLGISTYRKKFDGILNNRPKDLDELIRNCEKVPSSAHETYKTLSPIFQALSESGEVERSSGNLDQ